MSIVNLEPLCAKYGREIITGQPDFTSQENVVTRSLAVLAENGLYGMMIYLLTQDFGKNTVAPRLRELWLELGLIPDITKMKKEDMAQAVQGLADNLPKLILAKQVTESALIFARYHAKAQIKAPTQGGES